MKFTKCVIQKCYHDVSLSSSCMTAPMIFWWLTRHVHPLGWRGGRIGRRVYGFRFGHICRWRFPSLVQAFLRSQWSQSVPPASPWLIVSPRSCRPLIAGPSLQVRSKCMSLHSYGVGEYPFSLPPKKPIECDNGDYEDGEEEEVVVQHRMASWGIIGIGIIG